MRLPRVLIGAASSGSGKTSLAVGILGALKARGLDVRPFKAGPDYLDPKLHRAAAGAASRNLDPRLMGRAATLRCLAGAGSGGDLALVEGVMGFYDGQPASSADLARLIEAPAILALDASGAAESAAAVALGFLRYRRGNRIAAFIANRVGGESHYLMVKRAVEAATGLPMVGYLPADPALALPERHLGLVDPAENPDFRKAAGALAEAVGRHIDLETVLRIARAAPELAEPPPVALKRGPRVRIALALDEAFSFYYEDNLDMLRALGAELAPFSPLRDAALPEGAAALYLGGGYPELHGPGIAANAAMRDSVRRAALSGMPVYAECGGWLYLLEEIEGPEGSFPACAVLSGRARLGSRLAELGYREGRTLKASILGPAGRRLSGHVFHYSSLDERSNWAEAPALLLGRPAGPGSKDPGRATPVPLGAPSGAQRGSVFASWLHVHFGAHPSAARSFVAAARAYSARLG